MSKLYDHLRGHWTIAHPVQPGAYLMRDETAAPPWVAYWNADPLSPFASSRREFFHLEGDVDGAPTRWDHPLVVELAAAAGWSSTRAR